MKNLTIVILLLALIGIAANVENDTKIGYVYIELVLNNMDETKEMLTIVEKYSAEKQLELQRHSDFLNQKFKDYQKKDNANQLTDAARLVAEGELKGLQNALDALKQRTEQEIITKRSALLAPIGKKLEKAMDQVAEKYSYKYVLNSADGTGNSVVIVAPDADDLTQEVMEHLGISFE